MTRYEAIKHFSVAYIRHNNLLINYRVVRDIIENKIIETNKAFYLEGTTWKLEK